MIYNESFDLHSTTSILVSVNARTEEKTEKKIKKEEKRQDNQIEIITSKKRDYKNNRNIDRN